jgi:hypothetical protein
MSFEGYVMKLCQHGHLLEEGYDYSGSDHTAACEVCGAAWAWNFTVDETNDSGVAPLLEVLVASKGDDETYYLPEDDAPNYYSNLEGVEHVPFKPVQWLDKDHPDDGPFSTEREAWDNKAKRYKLLVKRTKHEQ